MTFPASVLPVDLRSLADRLTDAHAATIVGADGILELRFGDPPTLIGVLGPAQIDFFEDMELALAIDEADEEDPEHAIELTNILETVEAIVYTLEELLGIAQDDDDDDSDPEDAHAPDDDADRQARALLELLLAEAAIELVTPRSRAGVEGKLAHMLAHRLGVTALAEGLAETSGVAEVYIDDDRLAELLEATKARSR